MTNLKGIPPIILVLGHIFLVFGHFEPIQALFEPPLTQARAILSWGPDQWLLYMSLEPVLRKILKVFHQ